MQLQKYVNRDLRKYHISEKELADDLNMSQQWCSVKLRMAITPAFYNQCEQSISYLLHRRSKRHYLETKKRQHSHE